MSSLRADEMQFEILADGTIKTTIAGVVSQVNHSSADAFVKFLSTKLGSVADVTKIPHSHHHHHADQTREVGH
jgi:hypothetical protein